MVKFLNLMHVFLTLHIILICLSFIYAQTVSENAIKIIENYMDLSQDPCDDFFSYACGNWSNFHKSGRYSESTGLVDHKINKRFLGLFNYYIYGEDSILDNVMIFYKSCRRERKRNILRYLKIAKPIAGLNWPLLERIKGNTSRWPKEKFNWLLAVANLRSYGLNNVLLQEVVMQNMTDPTQSIIFLDAPNLFGAGRILPIGPLLMLHLKRFGLLNEEARAIGGKLKSFEEELLVLLEIEDDATVMSLNDIENNIPHLPWRKYFELLLGKSVEEDYVIQINNFAYLNKLADLLENADSEVICYYLMYHFLEYINYDRSTTSDKIDCVSDVRSKMDLAMNFIYAERFYNNEAALNNEDVYQIFKVIQKEFQKKLQENRLGLTESEVEYLKQKLETIKLIIGNLPKNVDRDLVEKFYENVNLSSHDYFRNHLELLKLKFKKEHELLFKKSQSRDEFFNILDSDTARSSTPFYWVRQNLIILPFGFLQTPIYHRNMLNVLKYSLFGFNIAHELAHGFDASGIFFDGNGTFKDIGGEISNNTNVTDSLECMQREETTSIDERVADLVGLRLVYDAYFNNIINDRENRSIPNAENSLEEIFFLNFAQFFCGNMASEFVDHDSDNVRLQQTLLNFEPFAEIFKCDLGSTMNPEVKCRLY